MTRYHRRRRPGIRETVTAAALAAGVAAVTFYVTRLLISREPLGSEPEDRAGRASGEGARSDP